MSIDLGAAHRLANAELRVDEYEQSGFSPVLATFDMLEIACLVITPAGRILSENATLKSFAIDLYPGWLRSSIPSIDQVLVEALAHAEGKTLRVSRNIPDLGARIILHRMRSFDAAGNLLVTIHANNSMDKRRRQFSAVEADILKLIASGQNLRETAKSIQTPYNTVRKYLQNMLTRTQCRTQAQLVAKFVISGDEGHMSGRDIAFTGNSKLRSFGTAPQLGEGRDKGVI